MRSRRQHLQVSTFPFLAVLLCAMGSLILLLLVLDRRARVVARARADRITAQVLADQAKVDELRRLEIDKRRQALRERLLEEEQSIQQQQKMVEEKARDAERRARQAEDKSRTLVDEIGIKRNLLTRAELELEERRKLAEQSNEKHKGAGAMMARLTADLLRLERTLAEVKAARREQEKVYSIIPYRGKRGDGRRPVYVECAFDGLVFQPGNQHVGVFDIIPTRIKEQVAVRLKERQNVDSVAESVEVRPYLLFLVRPNGVENYYRCLAALRGFEVDFGYEFIDQDWKLDFSQEQNLALEPVSPGRVTNSAPSNAAPAHLGGVMASKGPAIGEFRNGNPTTSENQPLTSREGAWAPGSFPDGNRPGPRGIVGPSPIGSIGPPGSSSSNGLNGSRSVRPGAAWSTGQLGANGMALSGADSGTPLGIQADTTGKIAGNPAAVGVESSVASGPGLPGITPSTGARSQQPSHSPTDGDPGGKPTGAAAAIVNQRADELGAPRAVGIWAEGNGRSTGQGHTMGPGGSSAPGKDPASTNDEQNNDAASSSNAAAAAGGPSRGAGAGNSVGGETGGSGGADSDGGGKNKSAFRPIRLTGNRDWIIPIECRRDELIILLTGEHIAVTRLAGNGKNCLQDQIEQLIARRQAGVRPGDPPYRPIVHFRVRPDGLKTYYQAYPALELSGVPLTRENLDPEPSK